MKQLFTSESVTEGHPDKICDQISDAILDDLIKQDPNSRVAVECLTTTGTIFIAGEVTTKGFCDFNKIARKTLKEIGYTDPEFGLDWQDCAVWSSIHEQSENIAVGVNEGEGEFKEQGAGDQGLMFGFACNETLELMPLPITLAHKLTMKLSEVRKTKKLSWVRPDGKSQVTVEYENGKPKRVDTVVIAIQHNPKINGTDLRTQIIKNVIEPVCKKWIDKDTKFFINATGIFEVGGPEADTGLTGRKIIVDTYGGYSRHGGGAFSGKDSSKVDRSAAYMARHIAKNVVAAELAEKCEVQLAYSIGVSEPVSIMIETFETGKIPEEEIAKRIRKVFPLKPAEIIKYLDLKKPIYQKTATYGHFGRSDPDFTWEQTNKVDDLKDF